MGTRCLTAIKEHGKDSEEIVVIYRQFDGYPDGHGKQLHDLFHDYVIVNGLGGQSDKVANGMSCFAAQVITQLKWEHGQNVLDRMKKMAEGAKEHPERYPNGFVERSDGMAGSYYLHPAGTRDCGEDYFYTLYMDTSCQDRIDEEFQQLAAECEKNDNYKPLHDKVRVFGEIYMMIECPIYDDQYKRDGTMVMYDGPLKDFSPEACVSPYDDDEEEEEEDDD